MQRPDLFVDRLTGRSVGNRQSGAAVFRREDATGEKHAGLQE
jgi:hypothetical protein